MEGRVSRVETTIIHIQGKITEVVEDNRRRSDGVMDAIDALKEQLHQMEKVIDKKHGFVAGVLFVFSGFFAAIAWFVNSKFF